MKRLYNTHDTMAFVKFYNSQPYIFQPKGGGEFGLVNHQTPAKTRRGKAASVSLERISDRKVPNWLDVPDVLAKIILTEDMKDSGPDGLPNASHHAGFIKEIEELQASIDADLAAKAKRLAELDGLLKKKEAEARVLDRELDTKTIKKG